MMTDAATNYRYLGHNRYRPARSLVLTVGIAVGLVMGCLATLALSDLHRAQANGERAPWDIVSIVCVGHTGNVYFLQNRMARDFRVINPADLELMAVEPLGLVPSSGKVSLPIWIPANSTTGIRIEGAGDKQLVLFDLSRRIRVALEGK